MNLRKDSPWAKAAMAMTDYVMAMNRQETTTGEFIRVFNDAHSACKRAFDDMTWQEQVEFCAKFPIFLYFVETHLDEDQINSVRIMK